MRSDSYLILLHQGKDLRELQDKFYEMGGFYNGIGYLFPYDKKQELKKIIEHLPGIKIHQLNFEEGCTLDSMRQDFNKAYLLSKLFTLDSKISSLKIDNMSEEDIENLNIHPKQKEEFIKLVRKKEQLKHSIEWSQVIKNTPVQSKKIHFQATFIKDQPINFLTEDPPEIPQLINYVENSKTQPFIRKGIVGMLVGSGGVGKTHALVQLALSIATGTPWLGKYPVEKSGYVFMGMGENSEGDIHRLIRKTTKQLLLLEQPDIPEHFLIEASKRLSVFSFNGLNASFFNKGKQTEFYDLFLQELKEKEPKEGWSCIILDPISRFIGSDAEIDNGSATAFIALLEKLILELKYQPTVLFGHHMNKSSVTSKHTDQSAARGSSAITDGVRWQANLERVYKKSTDIADEYELDRIILKVVKSNFTSISPPQILKKDQNGFLFAMGLNPSIFERKNRDSFISE